MVVGRCLLFVVCMFSRSHVLMFACLHDCCVLFVVLLLVVFCVVAFMFPWLHVCMFACVLFIVRCLLFLFVVCCFLIVVCCVSCV